MCPEVFPSVRAFWHWAGRSQNRSVLSAVNFAMEGENFCTPLCRQIFQVRKGVPLELTFDAFSCCI